MIEIGEQFCSGGRQCNSCSSSYNVNEILFKKGVSGTVIALCEDCREDLLEQLITLDLSERGEEQ